MPSVKVRATTPPAFRLCSSLSKRALDFNTSRYERTKLKLTLLWDCVVSFILLSKKCLFSYLDHQPCFKLLARKPVPHFGDSRSAFSLCSSQLNGERCAVTYSHAISNLTPPVSSSMAQLFGDSDPLKQHRRICSLSTFYFVYTSGLFSCFVRIDGWPQQGGVVNYASSFKPCTDSYSCECIISESTSQPEHNLHISAQTCVCNRADIARLLLSICKAGLGGVCPQSPVGSHMFRDLPMLAASIHCDRIRVTCSSPECPPSSHRPEEGGVGH